MRRQRLPFSIVFGQRISDSLGDDIYPIYQAVIKFGLDIKPEETYVILAHACDHLFDNTADKRRACKFLKDFSSVISRHDIIVRDSWSKDTPTCLRKVIVGVASKIFDSMHYYPDSYSWGKYIAAIKKHYGVSNSTPP